MTKSTWSGNFYITPLSHRVASGSILAPFLNAHTGNHSSIETIVANCLHSEICCVILKVRGVNRVVHSNMYSVKY